VFPLNLTDPLHQHALLFLADVCILAWLSF
jgi:hypothetical protein